MNRAHAAMLAGQSYVKGIVPRVDMDKFIEVPLDRAEDGQLERTLCIWNNPRIARPIRDVEFDSIVSVVMGSLGVACYEFEIASDDDIETPTHNLYGVSFGKSETTIKKTNTKGMTVLSSLTEIRPGKSLKVDAFMLRSLTPFVDQTVAVVQKIKEYPGNCRVAVVEGENLRISNQSIFNKRELWKSVWRALNVPFCDCGSPRMVWGRTANGWYCVSCAAQGGMADAA